MNHAPCFELDDEKSKEGSKEEIGHLQDVTRPDVCRVVVQERRQFCPPGCGERMGRMYF